MNPAELTRNSLVVCYRSQASFLTERNSLPLPFDATHADGKVEPSLPALRRLMRWVPARICVPDPHYICISTFELA